MPCVGTNKTPVPNENHLRSPDGSQRRSARLHPLPSACRRLLRPVLGCCYMRLSHDRGLLTPSNEESLSYTVG